MRYLLDANVFSEAANRYYGFDFCPAFWGWLAQANAGGRVFSIDKVYDELLAGTRPATLKKYPTALWAHSNKAFFEALHAGAAAQAPRISSHIVNRTPPYASAAQAEFLRGNADYWLIAHAMAAGDTTIVTHEIAAPLGKNRVKIPDVCAVFSIDCISPFEMLRREGARFVLPSP